MKKNSLKPEGQMLRGVVYRLIESLASMGHSSIWKLICAISVCYTLTVGVHLSSTPGIKMITLLVLKENAFEVDVNYHDSH